MFSEILSLILYHKLSVHEVHIHIHDRDTNLSCFVDICYYFLWNIFYFFLIFLYFFRILLFITDRLFFVLFPIFYMLCLLPSDSSQTQSKLLTVYHQGVPLHMLLDSQSLFSWILYAEFYLINHLFIHIVLPICVSYFLLLRTLSLFHHMYVLLFDILLLLPLNLYFYSYFYYITSSFFCKVDWLYYAGWAAVWWNLPFGSPWADFECRYTYRYIQISALPDRP